MTGSDLPRRDAAADPTIAMPQGSAGAPLTDRTIGTLVAELAGRFRVTALLGRGGMGEVYAADDLTLGRKVALKTIRPERRLAPTARERFQREARLLSRLDHPGICRIHDILSAGGRDVLVLELVGGRTLSEAADELDDGARLDVAQQIAAVLAAAHAEGIVHRDLKPDNIMLTPEGRIKVLDFGLARDVTDGTGPEPGASEPGAETGAAEPAATIELKPDLSRDAVVLGTPAYLSPEQARGEVATPASDMFAFGLVLQRLYTGERAYEDSEDLAQLLDQAREARTRPLVGVDRDLVRLITGLQQRSPTLRPTAAAASRQLAWIRRRPIRRLQRWSVAAAVLLVIVAIGKYTLDLRHERGIAEHHRAEAENLVEFMIGDLRERLEPVGRLDVLDEVGDRALAYFAARANEDRSDADQDRFARTMNQIGEVRLNQGDLEAAAEAFGEARRVAAALVARQPTDGAWLLTLGAAEFWLGNVAYVRSDLAAAEAAFLAYRAVAERLVALDAANEEWQRELGYAHTNLAALHEARHETEAATAELQASIRIKRMLVDAAPTDAERRSDLINSLAWLGSVRLADGRLAEALTSYDAAAAEAEILQTTDSENMAHRELWSSLVHLQARTLERLGRDEGAAELYRVGQRIAEQLVAHDGTNASWAFSLAASCVSLGVQSVRAGDTAAAFTELGRGESILRGLIAADPDNFAFLGLQVTARRHLAEAALARGEVAAAQSAAAAALAGARQIHAREAGPAASEALADCLIVAGDVDMRAGRDRAAQSVWSEAHGLLQPIAETSVAGAVPEAWVRILSRRGEREAARRAAGGLLAAGFARQDFRRFCASEGLAGPIPHEGVER